MLASLGLRTSAMQMPPCQCAPHNTKRLITMSQENNNNSHSSGGQGRQGGNNRNRNQNQNRNRNRNRQGERKPGNRSNQGDKRRQGGGGQRRRPSKPAPLTTWEKILKFLGLYKAPTRPPRRRPEATENAPKTNVRNARGKQQGEKKKQPSGPIPAKGRGAGEKGKDFPVETPRLYVGNLSYDANEHDLEELFKGIGTVKNVEIIYNRHTHRSRGYGFVQMLNVDDAEQAVEVLHDQPFMGRDMIVNGASSKPADTDESSNESDNSPSAESTESEDQKAAVTSAE